MKKIMAISIFLCFLELGNVYTNNKGLIRLRLGTQGQVAISLFRSFRIPVKAESIQNKDNVKCRAFVGNISKGMQASDKGPVPGDL